MHRMPVCWRQRFGRCLFSVRMEGSCKRMRCRYSQSLSVLRRIVPCLLTLDILCVSGEGTECLEGIRRGAEF